MYSLVQKTENAHEDSIWTCAWSCIKKQVDDVVHNEDSRDSMHSNQDKTSEYVVTGSVDDCVKVWEFKDSSLKLKHTLTGHSLGVLSVAISSDGTQIACSTLGSSLKLWDLVSGEKKSSIDVGPMEIWTIAYSPDDKFIVSGSHAGKLHLYNTETGKQEQTLDARGGKFTLTVAYSPNGKYIASGALDGIINIFDVAQGKVSQTLEGHAMPIRSLSFSPNSELLLTGSEDGYIKLYDVKTGSPIGTMSGHASWVLSVDFSRDGQRFASSSSDHSVKVWDLAQKSCLHTFNDHADQVWAVKYHCERNNTLVSVSEDKCINLYEHPV